MSNIIKQAPLAGSIKKKCIGYREYQKEREALSEQEIDHILEAGRAWPIDSCLAQGGVAVFPHTYLRKCGHQIAAAVHGALDCGADQVLALGVLHSLSDDMMLMRQKERDREDISQSPLRGVHGPEISRGDYWQFEYSLLGFIFLWEEEIKRRNIRAPKLIIRYPYLVNRLPESLPGIDELEALSRDSAIVASADFCHHGVIYGDSKEASVGFGPKGDFYARNSITQNLQTLIEDDYEAYYQHCLKIHSDAFDLGVIVHHLRRPSKAEIHNLVLVDVSQLFKGDVDQSWVAASLTTLTQKI